jgi:zinc D-Ala-D-Ala dipeptidase
MHGLYKTNLITFTAIVIALIFCVPLLGIDNTVKVSAKQQVSSASKPAQDAVDASLKASGLVNVCNMGANFVYDQRYGTTNNFTGEKLYTSTRIYLRPETAQKLADANKEFNSMGYRIKIWDAYRPYSVQKILYSKVSGSRKPFIANPYTAESSVHNKGAAVDITLVNLDGSPVEMPTDFDTFDNTASINYTGCSEQAVANRKLLRTVMKNHGFEGIRCEWWHFNDTDAWKYTIVDVMF